MPTLCQNLHVRTTTIPIGYFFTRPKDYYGIWKIEQDVFRTIVAAVGLDDTNDFAIRARTISATPEISEDRSSFKVMSLRRHVTNHEFAYAEVSMDLVNPERTWRNPHSTIQALTVIYREKGDVERHADVFKKFERGCSNKNDDVLEAIKNQIRKELASKPSSSSAPQLISSSGASPMPPDSSSCTRLDAETCQSLPTS